MLIHGNVDDEGTLEEEEMLEELEDERSSGELNDLQKVNEYCIVYTQKHSIKRFTNLMHIIN